MVGLFFYVFFFALFSQTFCVTEVDELTETELSAGSKYGYGLAAYGDLVVVGAPGDSSATNVSFAGTAFVYNCSGADTCELASTLIAPNPHTNDSYGVMVGVYGQLVAVGANHAIGNRGTVYVYWCADASNCTLGSVITPADAVPGDEFGWYVYTYGTHVLVGARGYRNSTGKAYLLDCTNYKNCTVVANFTRARGQLGDLFGFSVGMNAWLVAIGAAEIGNAEGGVYVYNCQVPTNCTQIASLSLPSSNRTAGNSSNISNNTNSTNAGAYFGSLLYVDGDILYVGAYGYQNATGAVFVYNCSSRTTCELTSTLLPTNVTVGYQFANFISAYKGKVVVGAVFAERGKGAAYVFNCTNPRNCTQVAYLTASDGVVNDQFGFVTAITQNVITVAAPYKNQVKGAVYTYWANVTST